MLSAQLPMESSSSTVWPPATDASAADQAARKIARIAVRNTAHYGQSCLAAEMLAISPEDASSPIPERTTQWTNMLRSVYLMAGLEHKLGDQGDLTSELNDQDLGDTLDALARARRRHEESIGIFKFQGLSQQTKHIFAETQALFEKPFRDKFNRAWTKWRENGVSADDIEGPLPVIAHSPHHWLSTVERIVNESVRIAFERYEAAMTQGPSRSEPVESADHLPETNVVDPEGCFLDLLKLDGPLGFAQSQLHAPFPPLLNPAPPPLIVGSRADLSSTGL